MKLSPYAEMLLGEMNERGMCPAARLALVEDQYCKDLITLDELRALLEMPSPGPRMPRVNSPGGAC